MHFGKLCTIFVCLISYHQLLFSDDYTKDNNLQIAIEKSHVSLARAIIKLELASKTCKKYHDIKSEKIKNKLPPLDVDQLKEALFYISMRNFSLCILKEENNALWALASIQSLLNNARKSGHTVDEVYAKTPSAAKELLVGISAEYLLARSRYESLPAKARQKIESIKELTSNNFDAFKLFEELNL